ncbi:MAG: hypothetical protein IJ849_00020 [Selenomonadaceae bacterium]|nr:hypothetical protein [Selenomonadaceae bacterium]
MSIITAVAFAAVFLLLWGKIFHYLHTHPEALSSFDIKSRVGAILLKLLLSFVVAGLVAAIVILVGEFALEMVFAYWYVTAIMVGLMTLALTESGRKTAIVTAIASVVGIFGNYFINAGVGGSLDSPGHSASTVAEQETESAAKETKKEQNAATGEKQTEKQQNTEQSAKQTAEEQKAAAKDEKQQEENKQNKKKNAVSGEVALGSIGIGLPKNQIQESLGEEIDVKKSASPAEIRYRYAAVDIITDGDDRIIGFSSNSDQLATPRGIKQGSSLSEVLSQYGKPATQTERDGEILYEYHFTSGDNRPCLLRFAIKNSQVDYISGRLLG